MAHDGRRPRRPARREPHAGDRGPGARRVGAAFFLLSLYYVASTVARMVKAARD